MKLEKLRGLYLQGKLNALPEKAKPLNKWTPPADGWKSVSDGLAKLFRKLMDERKEPRTK